MRIAEAAATLLPRLAGAGLIVLAGFWIGQYSSRSALVWAVNREMPFPREIACLIRSIIVFAAIVVAADTVGFATAVFLSAFLLIIGGIALAVALAVGLGGRDAVRDVLAGPATAASAAKAGGADIAEHSAWNHL